MKANPGILSAVVVRRPRLWLFLFAALTLFFAIGLRRLTVRTEGSAIYPEGSAVVARSEEDRLVFRDPEEVILLLSSVPGGPDVDSPAGLRVLRGLHRDLASQPWVDGGSVRSLANLPAPLVEGSRLSVPSLLDSIPEDSSAADASSRRPPSRHASALMRAIDAHPLGRGLFLSRDGRSAALYLPLSAESDRRDAMRELRAWMDSHREPDYRLRLLGPLVAETTLGEMVLRDLARLIPAMVIVITCMLFLFLRTPGGVLIPLLEAVLALVWTLGTMAYLRVPLTLVTTILPVVLMAMAITDEIHLLEKLQRTLPAAIKQGRSIREAKTRALEECLESVGPPIVATTLSTALGFLSFLSASIAPMRQFGLFAALGIAYAMVLSFTLVPALIMELPPSWLMRPAPRSWSSLSSIERRIARSRRHGWLLAGLLIAACVPGILRLRVEDAWVDNFSPRSPLVAAEREYNRGFWGSYRFDVVLQAGPGFFLKPEGTALVERISDVAARMPEAGGVLTYLAPLREIARTFGEDGPLSRLPDREIAGVFTVAQMLPGDLARLVVQDGSAARLRIFVPEASYRRAESLRDRLDRSLRPILAGSNVSYHFTGDLPVALVVVESIVGNQLRSIGWDVIGTALVLLLTLRSVAGAVMVLFPVLAADAMIFAGLGYLGVPLGIATSMFAAMTIGVGVDYGLHIYYGYRRERARAADDDAALARTLGATGTAIRGNAVALIAWFLVLAFSALRPNRALGLCLASAMLCCYATTLLFLPRMLRRFFSSGRRRFPGAAAASVGILLGSALVAVEPSAAAGSAGPADLARPGLEITQGVTTEAEAQQLMAGLAAEYRRSPRAVRLEITTEYEKRGEARETLWGVFRTDSNRVRILFVFTEPPSQEGTSLSLNLALAAQEPDSIWLYLASFRALRLLDDAGQRLLIPGTGLTYADARGYIPESWYDFRPVASQTGGDSLVFSARPRSTAIRIRTGYDSLRVVIDRPKRQVRRVDYWSRDPRPFKSYEVVSWTLQEGVWLPAEARVSDSRESLVSDMRQTFWPLRRPPDPGLFRDDAAGRSFQEKLQAYLGGQGIR
jgi:hypothetical protein